MASGYWRKWERAAMFFSKRTQQIRRILIVEDEPLLAFDNERALQQAGYEVVATVDRFRDAGAVILGQAGVDLVVTDIKLRGVRSGVELPGMRRNSASRCCWRRRVARSRQRKAISLSVVWPSHSCRAI